MRAPAWIAVALAAVALGACGSSSSDDRPELRTPDAGDGPSPEATATPAPEDEGGAPTEAEVAVIRGWSDTLRAGHVEEAAAYFTVPIVVDTGVSVVRLPDRDAVEEFNRGLPCGARMTKAERGPQSSVIATFRLTERPGPGECGQGTGEDAYVAFVIENRHIVQWQRVEPRAPAVPDDSRIS